MGDKEDYLTPYRMFFEKFAASVNPEDQLPVNIAGYTIAESELTGEVLYWITQYLTEKECPLTLMTPLRRIVLEEVRVASKKYPNDFGYKSEESVYIALRLMQAVTARVNDVCLRYLDNSRLDSLPAPPPLDQRDLKTVSCAAKNSRRVMEDRHVEIGNLEALFGIETTEPTSFYAVYDGHAGTDAATYCAAHLHQYLIESAHFTTDLTRAMRDAFLRTDAEFIRKSNQERVCGGSTAVAVTVRGKRLLAAWAGDSLALLAKRMRLMQLVRPHKPSRQDERDRIEKSGGTVMFWGTWRVNGQLAVSRAIGDAQYKPYVTAKPEIATVDLDGDEDFVVVACDGLWDFVSEDDVALSVYRQVAEDPDDLKAVTKRLILQAKRQGSADNISIIVVFLKDPRDIAADNCPPMDLGLDNALANASPFAGETEAGKRPADADATAVGADAEADVINADNGVDNSDSDSEDLGPETAVDADDVDADRNHEPSAPTPPVHAVEQGQVEGTALVDNVAESGDESEDEWNYFKGEGEVDRNPSEEHEPTRSDTPCQDNSAWETSSVDMNSSPLNPDAPVFIPGSVAGSDVLLAESPRKPVPMDDIELPDVKQFETEAVVRPAELLDLDNCDQLNGHHNASIEIKEHLNGNDKCMDSLGFGFNVGIEPDKVKDSSLIQDFERIQKDTTDFCDIQVFQTNAETNPFAVEGDDELFERLKNKERDPMSMSFYQEKDDDTCERLSSAGRVDLNAVQPLPDSDDDDVALDLANGHDEKENISPAHPFPRDEPNNDIINFHDHRTDLLNNANFQSEFTDFTNNVQPFSNIVFETGNITRDTVLQTDTPESHKLLFEQIPEIPDGKSSELGFTNDDLLDPSESEREVRAVTPQDETSEEAETESKDDDMKLVEPTNVAFDDEPASTPADEAPFEKLSQSEFTIDALSPAPEQASDAAITPEPAHEQENIEAEIHENAERTNEIEDVQQKIETEVEVPQIQVEERLSPEPIESPVPPRSPFATGASPAPHEVELPSESPLPAESPLPQEQRESQFPTETVASPIPTDASLPRDSPLPAETLPRDSPLPTESPLPHEITLPAESDHELARDSPLPSRSPLPLESLPSESPLPSKSPLPREASLPSDSPLPAASPLPVEVTESQTRTPLLEEILQPIASPVHIEAQIEVTPALEVAEEPIVAVSPASEPPTEVSLPSESPAPVASPLPTERESTPIEEPVEIASEAPLAAEPETLSTPAAETTELTPSAPAPDLLPEQVTDLDAVPESRAQEICVPVTSEIRPEDGERPAGTSTPPPTPAVEPLAAAPLAAAVAAGAAVAVGAAAAAAKPKTPATRKSSTPLSKTDARTPKSASKAAAPRTPVSAAKRPATAPATRTTLSATRAAPARTSATKPAEKPKVAPVTKTPPPIRAPAKVAAAAAAAAAAATATKPAAPAAAKPTPKPAVPAAPKPAAARVAPAPRPATARLSAPKPPAPRTTTTQKPTPRATSLSSARPTSAPTRPTAAAPTAAASAARKLPERKPLSNGDVKDGKPAPRLAAARPAPPRPAPRPAPVPPTSARSAAPRPATRAPLDKQSKDLANKRITAKAAPPRTAATKITSTKTAVSKIAPKKSVDTGKKEPAQNGLTNGTGAPELAKPPPSPPAHDNALLPDVIA